MLVDFLPKTLSKMASGFGSWHCLVAFFVFGIGSLSCQGIADELHIDDQLRNCNLYEGSWIHDDSHPIYEASNCPFIDQGFDCLKNGRTDKDYLKYRWKPSGCDLPRYVIDVYHSPECNIYFGFVVFVLLEDETRV